MLKQQMTPKSQWLKTKFTPCSCCMSIVDMNIAWESHIGNETKLSPGSDTDYL